MKTKINHIQNLLKCFYAWKILMKPFYTLYCHWIFFFFKCLLLYFTFSFHAAKISTLYYQRNILELIKLKKPMPVQTVFSLSKYCLQIGLQWLLISWFHYKILACLDKIMPVVLSLSTTYTESLFFKRESNFLSLLWKNSILLDRKQFSLFIIVTWHIIQHDSWT